MSYYSWKAKSPEQLEKTLKDKGFETEIKTNTRGFGDNLSYTIRVKEGDLEAELFPYEAKFSFIKKINSLEDLEESKNNLEQNLLPLTLREEYKRDAPRNILGVYGVGIAGGATAVAVTKAKEYYQVHKPQVDSYVSNVSDLGLWGGIAGTGIIGLGLLVLWASAFNFVPTPFRKKLK